jgi:hypothetical protein
VQNYEINLFNFGLNMSKGKDSPLSTKFQKLSLSDDALKRKFTLVSTNMQTNNGCIYLNVKSMGDLRVRSGDPILISPTSKNESIGNQSVTTLFTSQRLQRVGLHLEQSSQKIVFPFNFCINLEDIIMDSTILDNCPVSFGDTIHLKSLSYFYEASKITVSRVKHDQQTTIVDDVKIIQIMITQQLGTILFIFTKTFFKSIDTL